MAVLVGQFNDVEKVAAEAAEALTKAASMDPHGKELYGEERHGDGWGFLVVASKGDKPIIVHHRSTNPIFKDDAPSTVRSVVRVSGESPIILMMHARAASRGTPKNIFSTHPVRAVTMDGSELYMIHNGSFSVDEVKGYLPPSGELGRYNDTYIANLALARQVEGDLNWSNVDWLLRMTKTGANLGITIVNDGGASIITGSYHLPSQENERADRYYRLYRCDVEGGTAYFSSTIVDYYKPMLVGRCDALENGEYHKYRVAFNGSVNRSETWRLK